MVSIAELSIEEFRTLVRDTVREVLWEFEQLEPDPDDERELKPEVIRRLEAVMQADQEGQPRDLVSHEEMREELGLDG